MRKNLIYLLYILFALLFPASLQAQQAGEKIRINGKIFDASTKKTIPYVSVRIKNSINGSSSDSKGNFSFHAPVGKDTLIVSSLGYADEIIAITAKTSMPLRINLKPADYDLPEVVVKPKREKYSRKNNPAVDLARRIIERRDENSPLNKEFYSNERHEKLNIALNDFNTEKENPFGKKFKFIEEYIDTSHISGKPILHISARELIATDYYQKSPKRSRRHVKARRRNGIDDVFTTDEIEALYEEVFKDVDIFQDNISLFSSKFVSPLSKLGPTFYRYYIMDTIMIDGDSCIDLAFTPFNVESFGFTGHIYVTKDTTLFIKSVQMNVPHEINMNFVDNLNIKQDFYRTPDGTRLLTKETLTAELKIISAITGFYANREVVYREHNFQSNEFAQRILSNPAPVVEDDNATNKSEEYWSQYGFNEVSSKERSVGDMMKALRANPIYYWTEKCVSFLFTGWVPVTKVNPPLFYGPVNTTVSHNGLEGWRLRTGAMTTAYLNPHIFGNFYVAYGIGDNKWKYMGELEYSFKKKKEHPNEFPIHSLRLRYENDIYQYGQNYLYTNKDNLFISLKRQNDTKIGYVRKAEFAYTKEFYNHFSFDVTLRHRVDIASRFIPFERTQTIDGVTTSTFVNDLTRSEIEIGLRYAPKEKFIQSKWNRRSVTPEHPVFTLSHRMGIKGILGSEFNYHHTEFGFYKRFWFSAFGYTDCIIKAGKVWNKVPYPMLIIPNANLSYTIQRESYSLMNAMEFFNDEYASWDLTYNMNGLIFNRIPLIRKLNWREVISFRGMFGHLTSKNRPDPLNTGELFKFPYENDEYHYLGTMPYMEIGIGIENIFKVLRIDYVRRLTYCDLPGIEKWGIRVQFHVQF
ncbi:MAG: carboxypeptidase-like regulatory domain-containing protein [Bacteroidaceae bacterium]|nr:carboxypeptidase-like regulatory domain-containing protein [Bacteroidaceae bacterium]